MRATSAPPRNQLPTLIPVEFTPSGRAKAYKDSRGIIYTQYQVQKAKNAGLTPTQAAIFRKAGGAKVIEKARKRGENLHSIALSYARATGKTLKETLKTRDYKRVSAAILTKQTSPNSAKAKALQKIGWRAKEEQRPVGSSERKRGIRVARRRTTERERRTGRR